MFRFLGVYLIVYRSTLSFSGWLPYSGSFHSYRFLGDLFRCDSSLSLFALFCLFSPLFVFVLCSLFSSAFKLLSYWRWFRFLLFAACSFYNDVIFIWILHRFLQRFIWILYPFHQRLFSSYFFMLNLSFTAVYFYCYYLSFTLILCAVLKGFGWVPMLFFPLCVRKGLCFGWNN